eukprot:CAMPEP_0198670858 /NCGR_PEP_ID=MMETSP1467-20131203/83228_1 /TAXON_ID=1462469 /ORGANISM="unid. sp., Strain CCMP2135" /LENGTH=71 /DNA_ID=CAMNT_0044407643 /DNA_START=35 /DNA_END=247 /DNA_ORIENTATION=-
MTVDPGSRASSFKTASQLFASHLSFSHVTKISPNAASVNVFPESRAATFAIVSCSVTHHFSSVRSSLRRCA